MRYLKYLFVTFAVLLATAGRVSAADRCEPVMYAFGYAFSFNDSTLYLTNIQKVENVWVRSHAAFVIEQETYANQLKHYFEKDNVMNMTCGVCFDKKEKVLVKKIEKIRSRYQKRMKHIRIITIPETDFVFNTIVPLQIDNPEQVADKKKK